METQYISLNMTPTGVNPCFHISQYDVGRMLGFIVHSGGATVDLDTYTCTIEATRSDGTAITSAVATTDNIGTFEVTPTMSNKADKYRCQLIIVDENSKRIASLPFDMEVTKAAMDENSEAIEEDASLYQQYTEAVQGAIAEANADIQAEENARIAAVNAEATARANADTTLQNNIDAEATARQTADNTLQGNIDSEASVRASADSNLQSQINQIIAPSGEAPSAAEVQNARIGADGVTYDTLGNAIRGQVGDLKSALSGLTTEYAGTNLLKSALFEDGFFYNYSNGEKWRNDEYCYSTLLACRENEQLSLTISGVHTCFYNISREYISGTTNEEIIAPDNCKYIRVSIPIAQKNTAVLYRYSSKEEKQSADNLAYNTRWIDGKYYFNGGESINADWCLSREYISVKPNTNYYIGNVDSFIIGEYGQSKNYLSQIANNSFHSFQTSANTYFLRVSIPINERPYFKLTETFPDIIKCGDGQEFENLNTASLCQMFCGNPIYLYPGEYDVSETQGNKGVQISGDLIGIGNPKIVADLSSFDINFSPLNLRRKNIKVSNLTIECNNSRYCIHDEMGGTQLDGVKHIIEDCVLIQKTPIQADFTYPRSIGVGIGNHETLLIADCKCYSNTADSDIDVHTNYEGQSDDSFVIIKNCWTQHSISASAVNNTGEGKMVIQISGSCVDRIPFANNPTYNTIDFEQWNNSVRN